MRFQTVLQNLYQEGRITGKMNYLNLNVYITKLDVSVYLNQQNSKGLETTIH